MLKNISHSRLELKIGSRIYYFSCDGDTPELQFTDAPLSEIREALAQFLSYATAAYNAVMVEAEKKSEAAKECESSAKVEQGELISEPVGV